MGIRNTLRRMFGRQVVGEATRQPTAAERMNELREQAKLERIERVSRLMELARANEHVLPPVGPPLASLLESSGFSDYWLASYTDLLQRYSDGNPFGYPITQPNDRRYGSNFPFWVSEAQLSLLRAQSRLVVTMSPNARGLLNGLTSYVIGTGFKYKAVTKDLDPSKEDMSDIGSKGDKAKQVVKMVQRAIDSFVKKNRWSDVEQELFWRTQEDGECFIRLFPQNDGNMTVRIVEPEQITMPPGGTMETYSYGMKTPPDDVNAVEAYYAMYIVPRVGVDIRGMSKDDLGDEVKAREMVHVKANVKRNIKRGMPTFSYDTLGSFTSASKLRNNVGEGAAVQAAIAAIRQHETADEAEVDTMRQAGIDYSQTDTGTGRTELYQKIGPGSFLDIPKGMSFIPPPAAANANVHVDVIQMLLRSAGNTHNAPEWLSSGDASNNNYASSLTAEGPFTKNCERLQEWFRDPMSVVIHAAVDNAVKANRVPTDWRDYVTIAVSMPTVQSRDVYEETAAATQLIQAKVKSVPTVRGEMGLDSDKEDKLIEEWNKKHPDPAAAGAAPSSTGEQGVESGVDDELSKMLGEALVKKTITNTKGKKQVVWVNPDKDKPDGEKRKKVGEKPTQPRTKAPEPSEKTKRAIEAHVMVGASVQRFAEDHVESKIAEALGGEHPQNNEPVDIDLPDGHVECKTLFSNSNGKLTMDSYSQVRKAILERTSGKVFHTVVPDCQNMYDAERERFDLRKKPQAYYYRRGIAGSARLESMEKVKSLTEIKALMEMDEKDLPDGAKRTDGDLFVGSWKPVKVKDDEGRTLNGFKNSKTKKVVRAKK